MKALEVDVLVIGGGPAGLAAACKAREAGAKKVVLLERDFELGGILNQCIHNGFGLQIFQEELTGPEYAGRFIRKAQRDGVEVQLNTMVLEIHEDRMVKTVSSSQGLQTFRAGSIILAMGCRERTRDALLIPGSRPAGIYTAGTAQRYVNIEGFLPGTDVVVLGSGDIGLIMARRMALEGCRVRGVYELLPYTSGLSRNVAQCLNDFEIPLHLGHTITSIHGTRRLEGVTVAKVGTEYQPLLETEQEIQCDTLLLSVGLIPENELSRQAGVNMDVRTGGALVDTHRMTCVPGIFACGNVLQVHDLVDDVTRESELAGINAAYYAQGMYREEGIQLSLLPGEGLRHVVPQFLRLPRDQAGPVDLYIRGARPLRQVQIGVQQGKRLLKTFSLPYLKPGEMVRLTLKEEVLKEIQSHEDIQLWGRGKE